MWGVCCGVVKRKCNFRQTMEFGEADFAKLGVNSARIQNMQIYSDLKPYYFFLDKNAQIKTKIHRATVQPPKRFTRNIKNVAVAFLPDAMMVGKK